MITSPIQNTIISPLYALKSQNRQIAFRGNINEDVFYNRDDNDSLKKIFDTPDSEFAGMQYFKNFLVLNNTKRNTDGQSSFDFEHILNNLKTTEFIDENWVRENIVLFEKLYGIDSAEDFDSNLLSIYQNDLNRNKKSITFQLESEYLKEKLSFLNSKIPQSQEWNENNISNLNISAIKNKAVSPLYILSKSIKNQQKPSIVSLQNKTNSNVFEMPDVKEQDFIQTLDNLLNEAEHSQNTKKNLIVVNNLYKYINQNKQNFDSFAKKLETLASDKNALSSPTIILDLEGFNTSLEYSPEITLTLNEIPFYENEKRAFIESLISASNNSAKVHNSSCVILEGNSPKDVAALISAISNEIPVEIQTVKNDLNIKDLPDILNEYLKKGKAKNQKPIIHIPDFYRYTAFDENNRKFINEVRRDKKAVLILTSGYNEKLKNIINEPNLSIINLAELSFTQLVKILKNYVNNADDFINDRINKGEKIPPIKLNLPYESIIKDMQCKNKNLGFADIKNIVELAKNNYIKNPEKSFEYNLFEIITSDTKDCL